MYFLYRTNHITGTPSFTRGSRPWRLCGPLDGGDTVTCEAYLSPRLRVPRLQGRELGAGGSFSPVATPLSGCPSQGNAPQERPPPFSQSVSQSVRVPAELFSGRQTKPHPSSFLCPSRLLPISLTTLSSFSSLLLTPGTDTAGILCDHHSVRPPLALVVVLVVLVLVGNNTVFCKYCGTQSSLIKPLLKLQGLGSTHSLQTSPVPALGFWRPS